MLPGRQVRGFLPSALTWRCPFQPVDWLTSPERCVCSASVPPSFEVRKDQGGSPAPELEGGPFWQVARVAVGWLLNPGACAGASSMLKRWLSPAGKRSAGGVRRRSRGGSVAAACPWSVLLTCFSRGTGPGPAAGPAKAM